MWNRVCVYEGVRWYAEELRQAIASKNIYKKIGRQNNKGLLVRLIHSFPSFLELSTSTHITNPLQAPRHNTLHKIAPGYHILVLLPQ